MSDLKSTPADRAAVLGKSWDGDGWKNGLPVDDNDYTRDARESALRGDNVRASYFATMALIQGQRQLVEQQRIGNLIAYVNLSDREVADYRDHPGDWCDFDPDEIADRREVAAQQILEGLGI